MPENSPKQRAIEALEKEIGHMRSRHDDSAIVALREQLRERMDALHDVISLLRSHPAAPQQGEGDPVAPSIRALAAQEAIRVRNCISILRDRFPDPSPFAQFVGEELDTMARNILALGTRQAPEPSGISGQLDVDKLIEAGEAMHRALRNELAALEVGDVEIGRQPYADEEAATEIMNAMGAWDAAKSLSSSPGVPPPHAPLGWECRNGGDFPGHWCCSECDRALGAVAPSKEPETHIAAEPGFPWPEEIPHWPSKWMQHHLIAWDKKQPCEEDPSDSPTMRQARAELYAVMGGMGGDIYGGSPEVVGLNCAWQEGFLTAREESIRLAKEPASSPEGATDSE